MMSRLVPELRFKEFSGEWEEKALDKLLEFKNGINANKEQYGSGYKFINVLDILNNEFISHDKIIGSVNVDETVMKKYLVEYGDILFQRSSETQDEVGTASVYLDEHNTATFGGFVIRGKKIGEYEPIFLNKLLQTNLSRKQITLKSAGSTRYNVGQGILSSILLPFPSLPEQQKIANCLSSLDSLIEVQNKKVEALKAHKKGLMQQLFPSEGETVPKLRFDGFSGEWEEKEFEKIFDRVPSKKYQIKSDEYLEKGKYPVVDQGKLKIIAYSNNQSKLFLNNGIIIFGDHTRILKYIDFDFIVGADGTQLIRTKKEFNNKFLYYQLLKNKIPNTGYNRHFKFIKDMLFYIPQKIDEQEKIANCLSSLDSLIEVQNKKAEALKEHKKGLMQQLFVSGEVMA